MKHLITSTAFISRMAFIASAMLGLTLAMGTISPVKAQDLMNFKVVNDWGSGFEANIELTNPNDFPLDEWRLEFDFDRAMSSIWNAEIDSHTGNHYVIRPPSWDKTLPARVTISFGFIGTPGNVTAGPANPVLSTAGTPPVPEPAPPPPVPEPSPTPAPEPAPIPGDPTSAAVDIDNIRITYEVQTDWGTGYQALMTIQNNRTQPLTDWTLEFDLAVQISSLWDAVVSKHSGERYTLTPPSWKKDIQVGETFQFGFIGVPGAIGEPTHNFAFNGTMESTPAPGSEPPAPEPPPIPPVPEPTPPDPTPDPAPPPAPGPGIQIGERVICGYYPEWGIYQRNYQVADIPAHQLNVINYAFANINANGEVCLFDSWAAVEKAFPGDTWDQPLKGNFNQLLQLKARAPHVLTMISIGGWTLSGRFSDVALTDASRQKFAQSAVDFMMQYGFDGIDIDWEYPVSGGLGSNITRPEDKHNYTLLLAELRRQLDDQARVDDAYYYLSIAAPAGYQIIANLEPAAIAAAVNWINLMTYDFHGGWENITDHHAPLYAPPGDWLNVDTAVHIYQDAGVPAEKIVVGVPFYGRSWKNVPATNNGLRQPASGVPMGTWDDTGIFDYQTIIDLLASQPALIFRLWDDLAKAPFIYAPSLNNGMFITYDDLDSIQWKVNYVRTLNLGGIMIWDLSSDSRDETNSLLSAIYRGFTSP